MGKSKDFAESFVRVSDDCTHFSLGSHPFYIMGANVPHAMKLAANSETRGLLLDVLDSARSAGLNVLRLWAFQDGRGGLQRSPGEFDETMFRGLDLVAYEAGRRNLRLILVLTNYGRDGGGMRQYCRWSCQRRGVLEDDSPENFYDDAACQDIFKAAVVKLVDRENQLSKVAYREDPTIMAWSLANEARCVGDYSGSKLQKWALGTAEFLKSVDPNHLVTLDIEGFFGGSSPDYVQDNPFDALNLGVDFFRNFEEELDFASCQLWPDQWLPTADESTMMGFCLRWLEAHVELSRELGKPLLVSAFGKKPAGPERTLFFAKVYEQILELVEAQEPMAGVLLWMQAVPGMLPSIPNHVAMGMDAEGLDGLGVSWDVSYDTSYHVYLPPGARPLSIPPSNPTSPSSLDPGHSIRVFKDAAPSSSSDDEEDSEAGDGAKERRPTSMRVLGRRDSGHLPGGVRVLDKDVDKIPEAVLAADDYGSIEVIVEAAQMCAGLNKGLFGSCSLM